MRISFLLTFWFLLTIQVFGQNSKYNTTDILNVRAGAGINYAAVGQLTKGEKVTVISESNEWTQITTTNGVKGYVTTSFLSATSSNIKKGNGKGNFVVAFFIGFFVSLIPFLVYNGATTKKDGRSSTGYRVIKKGWNLKTSNILLFCTTIGIVFSLINLFSKTDATPSTSEKGNLIEIPKIEEKQVAQEPQNTNPNHGWKTFKHKYGFSIELPDYFSEGMLTNDAIQRYNLNGTFDDHISIATIGEGSQASLTEAYQSTLKSSENVAYKVLQNNWFVITGQQKDGAIYYLKTIVKNGQTHYLSVSYPNDQKEQFDKILPRIANSFQ